MGNNNLGKINQRVPQINGLKKPPVNINKKSPHFNLKNISTKPQPSINQSMAYTSIISYVVVGLILFIVSILYFTSGNNTPQIEEPEPKETRKAEVKKKSEVTEGRELTKREQEQCTQAIQSLEDVATVIDKYIRMQKENITESDKMAIKNASKKMDEALGVISELTERTGTQLLGSTRHNENRKKLTVMMMDLGIAR